MRHVYGWNHILVDPDELREFAWSAPMRDLAAKVDLSDVGLKKLLASFGIVTPPQGYWNKMHAGKAVPKCPKAPPRRPGEIGRVRLDETFCESFYAGRATPLGRPVNVARIERVGAICPSAFPADQRLRLACIRRTCFALRRAAEFLHRRLPGDCPLLFHNELRQNGACRGRFVPIMFRVRLSKRLRGKYES